LLVFRVGEMKRHGVGQWAVVDRATDALVGYCGLQLCLLEVERAQVPAIELFYGLARERWGEGLITEAAGALVVHGFGELRLPRIVTSIQRANARWIEVARRVGMTIEDDPVDPEFVLGVLRNPALAGETPYDGRRCGARDVAPSSDCPPRRPAGGRRRG
jgi:RimJ/RimL family protein N-acetyltransferase